MKLKLECVMTVVMFRKKLIRHALDVDLVTYILRNDINAP